jgi:hypothetical protein
MKYDIYIALLALSSGWSMHAALARKFCLRCKLRQYALGMILRGITQSNFWKKFIFVSGVQIYIGSSIFEITRVFGFKRTFEIASNIVKEAQRARRKEKTKNVS